MSISHVLSNVGRRLHSFLHPPPVQLPSPEEFHRWSGHFPNTPEDAGLPAYPRGKDFWEVPPEEYHVRNADGSPEAPEGWRLSRCFLFYARPGSTDDVMGFYEEQLTERGWRLIEKKVYEERVKGKEPKSWIVLKRGYATFTRNGNTECLRVTAPQWFPHSAIEVELKLYVPHNVTVTNYPQ